MSSAFLSFSLYSHASLGHKVDHNKDVRKKGAKSQERLHKELITDSIKFVAWTFDVIILKYSIVKEEELPIEVMEDHRLNLLIK